MYTEPVSCSRLIAARETPMPIEGQWRQQARAADSSSSVSGRGFCQQRREALSPKSQKPRGEAEQLTSYH